jgi:hypothetical protein
MTPLFKMAVEKAIESSPTTSRTYLLDGCSTRLSPMNDSGTQRLTTPAITIP